MSREDGRSLSVGAIITKAWSASLLDRVLPLTLLKDGVVQPHDDLGGTPGRARGWGNGDHARPGSVFSRLIGIRSPSPLVPPPNLGLPPPPRRQASRRRPGPSSCLLTTVATTAPTFAWATSAFSPSDEQLLFTLTNQDRASAGLNALTNDSYLHKEAEWRPRTWVTVTTSPTRSRPTTRPSSMTCRRTTTASRSRARTSA